MEHVRIDISQDLDGDDVVHACFDLSPDELAAAAHAVSAYAAERFRTSELSSDDVLYSSIAGVLTGMEGPIPESFADFWRPGGGVLALPRRQHEISTYIAAGEFRRWLHDAATAKEKQRVASASAAKASLWLTSFPTTPELIMADDDFIIGVKHRLGVPLG